MVCLCMASSMLRFPAALSGQTMARAHFYLEKYMPEIRRERERERERKRERERERELKRREQSA